MSLVVVNGYFRSGTSILWRQLAAANPGRKVVYEPCHNDLFRAVHRARLGLVNDLHQFATWSNYLELSDRELQRLRWSHPNLNGRVLPENYPALAWYIANLQEVFGADAVLQTNRWQFFLGDIAGAGAEVLHIIRNPFSVYASISRNGDHKKRRHPTEKLRGLLNPADRFYGWRMRQEIGSRYGHRSRFWQRLQPFETFVYCWVISNHAALNALGRGRTFTYEEICLAPERFLQRLRQNELKLATEALNRRGVALLEETAVIDAAARRLGIDQEWRELREFMLEEHAGLSAPPARVMGNPA
jgi:hypothetical protein